jgi:alpha-beta hydrolase superfamily lysophospholipase
MKRLTLFAALVLTLGIAVLAGCSTLDERQRAWIFQPSDRSWSGGLAAAEGMDDIWIGFKAKATGDEQATLHGLWLPAEKRGGPILLYLHGARFNVTGSAPRMRRMQELGFSVLGVDYRGFGKSTAALPSEESAYEDARAAWDWLARTYPDRPRYIFGHSLGGPIAINLATEVNDESGTIVEGTFTSIADVVSSSKWGWMPVSLLITQRFEAARKVARIGSPLLVVHGGEDRLILPDLGRKLYEAAALPKLFVLVEGGSHHNTNAVGQAQYREALAQLFSLK